MRLSTLSALHTHTHDPTTRPGQINSGERPMHGSSTKRSNNRAMIVAHHEGLVLLLEEMDSSFAINDLLLDLLVLRLHE